MAMFDERLQLELYLSPYQGFTGLYRDTRSVNHAVDAVLPKHCDDDSPCDLPYRFLGCGELIDIV